MVAFSQKNSSSFGAFVVVMWLGKLQSLSLVRFITYTDIRKMDFRLGKHQVGIHIALRKYQWLTLTIDQIFLISILTTLIITIKQPRYQYQSRDRRVDSFY
jgi:hypothetical protein